MPSFAISGMALIGLICFQLCSCEFFSGVLQLEVQWPLMPVSWPSSLHPKSFRIRYIDPAGCVCSRRVSAHQEWFGLEVQKGAFIPVTAEPLVTSLKLPPCGGLFPLDSENEGRLALKWKQGVVCEILLELASHGIAVDWINAERLYGEIEARSRGDPFDLDKTRILESLVSGSFRVTDIKPLPSRIVDLIPGKGAWFTESPFSRIYETLEGEALELQMSYGYHYLISRTTPALYIIQVTDQEIIVRRGVR